MIKINNLNNGIPISISLESTLESEGVTTSKVYQKKRLLYISLLAVLIAFVISFIAKILILLINFFTSIAFHGSFSISESSPADNSLGLFIIFIPIIGGVIVGLMALYGSKAIRGHGIPEAMEQILSNKSKIKPSITYLKPLSAAISIGTGGPFGAEGPIIATGGAFGSTIGQILKISDNERKILLAAGATAGMSAIFGSPIAAIFLAIELLLFEFSPRSIIPVALACITGAAGHHLFFGDGVVFPVDSIIGVPGNSAIAAYSVIGIIIGLLSVLITKIVYLIEDSFEKIPIHWMWHPAIGGLFVGIIGYFAPRTLGVGYENITELLLGSLPIQIVLSLCLLKFASWSIALGSGTSGGTLAPLLTIGGATGALLGSGIMILYPESGISLPLAALVGMSAMFAGASRALLTSIIFAIETTGQPNALLPLLASCTASYFVSFIIMENTIMTEKIARRGVITPHSYEPDVLEKITVGQIIKEPGMVFLENTTLHDATLKLASEGNKQKYFIVCNEKGEYSGVVSLTDIFSSPDKNVSIANLATLQEVGVKTASSLRKAVEIMAKEGLEVLPVLDSKRKNSVVGLLSYQEIIQSYKRGIEEHENKQPAFSLKRQGLKIIVKGQRAMK